MGPDPRQGCGVEQQQGGGGRSPGAPQPRAEVSRSRGPGCRRKAWSSRASRLKRSVWLRHCSSSSRTRTWAETQDEPPGHGAAWAGPMPSPRSPASDCTCPGPGAGHEPSAWLPGCPHIGRLRVETWAPWDSVTPNPAPSSAACPSTCCVLTPKGVTPPHHHHGINSGVLSTPWLVTLPQPVTHIPALRDVRRGSGHHWDRSEPTPRSFSQGSGESPSRGSWVRLAGLNPSWSQGLGFRDGQGLCVPGTVAGLGLGLGGWAHAL